MSIHEERAKKERMLQEHSRHAKLESLFHQKLSGTYLADMVFGANDGIITTFAVIAGAEGATLSSGIIIVLGFANLLADGISMGVGNYLGAKSEHEYQKRQRQKEAWEIKHFPEIEKQEVRDIFARKGFVGNDLDRAVEIVTSNEKLWIDIMMLEELKVIEDPDETPVQRGFVTFMAFILAGFVPLIPFLFGVSTEKRFLVATLAAGATLFLVGALRSKVTVRNWFTSGLEVLFVGALAAGAAYGIGAVLQPLL